MAAEGSLPSSFRRVASRDAAARVHAGDGADYTKRSVKGEEGSSSSASKVPERSEEIANGDMNGSGPGGIENVNDRNDGDDSDVPEEITQKEARSIVEEVDRRTSAFVKKKTKRGRRSGEKQEEDDEMTIPDSLLKAAAKAKKEAGEKKTADLHERKRLKSGPVTIGGTNANEEERITLPDRHGDNLQLGFTTRRNGKDIIVYPNLERITFAGDDDDDGGGAVDDEIGNEEGIFRNDAKTFAKMFFDGNRHLRVPAEALRKPSIRGRNPER